MAKIIPGILTADEEDYHKRLVLAENETDLAQIDLVDGFFSTNKTVGVNIIKKYPPKCFLEIQLMVAEPLNYIVKLAPLLFVSKIIFPFEIDANLNLLSGEIKKHNKLAGLSLNPHTPIGAALNSLVDFDLILLMTGNPGFSGQKLGGNTYERIKEVKRFNPNLPLEIDIGVNSENAQKLAETGADFLVASSALYNAPDFHNAYQELAQLASKTS